MDELLSDFLSETLEELENLDNQLVELEHNPNDNKLLASIFRMMHNIKGTCGFLALDKLESVAHAGENIMDKIRNQQLQASEDNISLVLEAIDAIKAIVAFISKHAVEPDTDYTNLINKIKLVTNNIITDKNETSSPTNSNIVQEVKTEPEKPVEKITEETKIIDNISEHHDHSNEHHEESHLTQTIRVTVEILESLMQIVSELVLNRNQLIQLDRTYRDAKFSAPIQRLNLITSALQETVMETRMQPIQNAWIKIPRMVRDLAKELKKKIDLVMIGEETELDRQLIEAIKDPLTHMIRNAMDHGLESPEDRLAAGKSETGVVTLKAYHQGGHIIIEVSDDGRGLSISKIKNKALQKNLATKAELESITDQQAIQYIFNPGFSTAEVITEISGRGVGMDVVKNNIENIRGTVEIQSVEGKGSIFIIKIPLTLAIMPILVIEAKKQKFGIPQINITEMVRAGGSSEYVIEELNNHKVLRLRESLLPLITLSEILQLQDPVETHSEGTDTEDNTLITPTINASFIVVCEANASHFGIIVDRIYDTEEIVLKPVSNLIKSAGVYSGNTLLGNGDVILILDPTEIVKFLPVRNVHTEDEESPDDQRNKVATLTSFLILKAGHLNKAIPLEFVSRLEEIDITTIETTNNQHVVQYRDTLMYLANLDPEYKIPKEGKQQVVVFVNHHNILGLVVEEIIDIVEQDITNDAALEVSNLKALVIADKTMEVLDINDYFNQIFEPQNRHNTEQNYAKKPAILFIDDSLFFRKLIPSKLEQEGFEVVAVGNAIEALAMLEKQPNLFNFVVTDINMPCMDGYQFATTCGKNKDLQHIPIIALTSNNDVINEHTKNHHYNLKACVSKTNQRELFDILHKLSLIQDRKL